MALICTGIALLVFIFISDCLGSSICKLTHPHIAYATCKYGCCNETATSYVCCDKSFSHEMIWGLVVCLGLILFIIGCIVSFCCRRKHQQRPGIILATTNTTNIQTVVSNENCTSIQLGYYPATMPPLYEDLPPSYESVVAMAKEYGSESNIRNPIPSVSAICDR